MNWLLWRQHRSQAFVTLVGVGLFAVAVVLTGVHMAHVYDQALGACTGNGTCDLIGRLFSGYGAIIDLVHLSIVLPLLVGTFVGATLVARERENATNVLVWTQSVTRRRWLFSQIATVVIGTLITSAVVSALVTWWSNTPNALNGDRFQGAQFDTQNIVPIAYAIFGVALGIAAGCILRRTLPALATTVGVFVGVRVLVSVYLRPHYLKAFTRSFPMSVGSNLPSGSWNLRERLVDGSGKGVGNLRIQVPSGCAAAGRTGAEQCLDRLGYHNVVTYQPPSHYWPFQWVESGIFVALAIGLIVAAIVFTLRRDA